MLKTTDIKKVQHALVVKGLLKPSVLSGDTYGIWCNYTQRAFGNAIQTLPGADARVVKFLSTTAPVSLSESIKTHLGVGVKYAPPLEEDQRSTLHVAVNGDTELTSSEFLNWVNTGVDLVIDNNDEDGDAGEETTDEADEADEGDEETTPITEGKGKVTVASLRHRAIREKKATREEVRDMGMTQLMKLLSE